jgi:hypothetical protein
MATQRIALYLAAHIVCAWWLTATPTKAAEFYAIVERDGTVVYCLSKGALLFSDRCTGDGRLTIVEPMREGPVVWRTAPGTVAFKNETQSPACAFSYATWDTKAEKVVSTGRKISKPDRAALLQRLRSNNAQHGAGWIEDDITAFALDLDNDGKDEIVFVVSDVDRVAQLWERDQKTRPYAILAGILPDRSNFPASLYNESGDYEGGTDAIGSVKLKGVVSIAPGTGEVALLINTGSASGRDRLIRYRHRVAQDIEIFRVDCG